MYRLRAGEPQPKFRLSRCAAIFFSAVSPALPPLARKNALALGCHGCRLRASTAHFDRSLAGSASTAHFDFDGPLAGSASTAHSPAVHHSSHRCRSRHSTALLRQRAGIVADRCEWPVRCRSSEGGKRAGGPSRGERRRVQHDLCRPCRRAEWRHHRRQGGHLCRAAHAAALCAPAC